MTPIFVTCLAVLTSLCLVACDDGGDELTTSQSALSTSQAFDACMEGLEDCRLPDADLEECRTLELECAPDRSTERADDWLAFCDGVHARCENDENSEALCQELQLRCELGANGSAEPREEMDPQECRSDCMEAMDDSAICDERCGTQPL